MKKNDHVIGRVIDYTNEGMGVVKIDGFPLFVKNVMLDEEVKLVVTKVNKHFGYGKVLEYVESSKQRVIPKCPQANKCGGCQLAFMSYEAQLAFKQRKVANVMQRIAKVDCQVNPIKGMDYPFEYRNKGQIPVGVSNGNIVMGFYRIHSNDIIPIDYCYVQSEMINKVLNKMKQLLQKYQNAHLFRHLLVKHGFTSQEMMVVFIVRKKHIPHLKEMVEELVKDISLIKTIVLNINQRSDNVILGEEEIVVYGDGRIKEQLGDLVFNISSKSFFQVNPIQTLHLYQQALEFANLTKQELVIDLYCGVGSISLFLAKQAKKVIGIEIVSEAIEDAKRNALMNGIENVEFVCSDAGSYAKYLQEQNIQPDVIVVDPPRKGCDILTIDSICLMSPKRVVYISCDPATLARDVNIFEQKGYHCEQIQPFDLFPQSYHVENVVLMSRKEK